MALVICASSKSWSEPDGVIHRIRQGDDFAAKSLYINLALLLWSFRILERPDAPIDVNDYTHSIIAHAAPFCVDFIPWMEAERLKGMIKVSDLMVEVMSHIYLNLGPYMFCTFVLRQRTVSINLDSLL